MVARLRPSEPFPSSIEQPVSVVVQQVYEDRIDSDADKCGLHHDRVLLAIASVAMLLIRGLYLHLVIVNMNRSITLA